MATHQRQPGDPVPTVQLPSIQAIQGKLFNSESLQGNAYMLAFFRFASCPFCNLRVHELVKRFDEFADGFNIVAIFDSSLDNLIHHAKKHAATFPILADETGEAYQTFGVQRSFKGFIKGMVTRAPTLLKGMAKGYLPLRPKGSLIAMPAEFLVNPQGVIEVAYYGKDEGDHLPFDTVRAFSEKNANSRVRP